MTTVDLSRVLTLWNKALKSHESGHYARSDEYYDVAVQEARALNQPAECLIIAVLLAFQADTTYMRATMPGVSDTEALTLLRKAAAHLEEVAPMLRRRAEAGTLMGKGLRAAEVQLFKAHHE